MIKGGLRAARKRRHARVRAKVAGTASGPRLCVFRSLNHLYVQAIDDEGGVTLAQASSAEKAFSSPEKPKPAPEPAPEPEKTEKTKGNKKGAAKKKPLPGYKVLCSGVVGGMIAKRLLDKDVKTVVFDRNGFLYHGRVRALAEAARKAGLKF